LASKFFHKPKSVAIQLFNLNAKYKGLDYSLKRGNLVWKQKVRPSEISREYEITIKYNGNTPEIYLYNQGIMKEKNEKIPHCYERFYNNENNEYVKICIYYPKNQEWSRDMLLSDTIVPWAIDWIHFYELWRITGKWLGGGVEHGKN